MDKRVQKLAVKFGGDLDLAEMLVQAGLDTPAKIKKATDKTITAIPDIGEATLKQIRAKVPKRKRKV